MLQEGAETGYGADRLCIYEADGDRTQGRVL